MSEQTLRQRFEAVVKLVELLKPFPERDRIQILQLAKDELSRLDSHKITGRILEGRPVSALKEKSNG